MSVIYYDTCDLYNLYNRNIKILANKIPRFIVKYFYTFSPIVKIINLY